MINFLQIIWVFLKRGNNLLTTILILLFLGAGIIIYFQNKKIANLNDKYVTEVKLNNALHDSVSYVTNQYGEVVAEKLTLQTTVKNLEDMNDDLTSSQKELLIRIKIADKENSVIAAALIEAEALIDSLMGAGFVEVNPEDTTIVFTDTTEFLIYNIEIGKAVPAKPEIKPTILFKHLRIPNKQFIEFHWKNNKEEGYPIEFSVSNSNPYFKTFNINSYAIPELKPEILKPTGWQKVGKWFTKNGKIVGFVAGGIVIGAGGTYILMK